MKRKKFTSDLFSYFLLVYLILLFFTSFSAAESNILYVGINQTYHNIQDAVDDAENNDSIIIYNGNYTGKIYVNKSLEIIGRDYNKTIIDGEGHTSVFFINSNYVKIKNLTMKNVTIGVYISGSFNIIDHNTFYNTSNAIFLQNSSNNNSVCNNLIINNHDGVHLYNSSYNSISNNSIQSSKNVGISLWEKSYHNIISNNLCNDSNKGIVLRRWCNNNIVEHNIIFSNQENIGINIANSFNNLIFNNTIVNCSDGIYIKDSKDNNITGNLIKDCRISGIHIDDIDDNYISETNVFVNNNVELKDEPDLPSVKFPSFEVVIIIMVAFAVLIVFFFKPSKKAK